MTEEQVTKALLKWLLGNGWEIVCFDFPQSGTGRLLHPNNQKGKNKDSINPDIVAVRNETCLFFENKDRFYYPDYQKVHNLIVFDAYSESIEQLLSNWKVNNIYYGIGLPTSKHGKASRDASELVDFIVGVQEDRSIRLLYHSCPNVFE